MTTKQIIYVRQWTLSLLQTTLNYFSIRASDCFQNGNNHSILPNDNSLKVFSREFVRPALKIVDQMTIANKL